MSETQLALLIALLIITVPLVALARRAGVSYPIVLVAAGLVLGFVPGLPDVRLDPNVVLLLFLPPLLYWEAITAPTDIMLANRSQIAQLAVGLVAATTVAVAVAMHAVIPAMSWAVAFVLGAIVAPTDELASAPVLERFRIPRHVIAIVEGESLVNDALSLVLYAAAVGAVVTGRIGFGGLALEVLVAAIGAVILGLAVGRAAVFAWRRLSDTQLQGVISLVVPFLSYLPAQRFNVSGVLAVVTCGVYVNQFTPVVLTPATRLQLVGFWETFVFVANAMLFLLVGFQLHSIAAAVFTEYSWPTVLWYTLAINAVVVGTRFAWVLGTEYLPLIGASSEHEDGDWKHATIVAWSGLRGAVSLAAALAIPLTVAGGAGFPKRNLIIFLTFSVILVTVVLGGLTLPALIKLLGAADDDSEERDDRKRALLAVSDAALVRLGTLEKNGDVDAEHATLLRRQYEHQREIVKTATSEKTIVHKARHVKAERALIQAQRDALVALRERGEIDNTVLREVTRSLDLADGRIRERPY